MRRNHLHIAISSDVNYLDHCVVLVKSVVENNRSDFEKITVHLLSNSIPEIELSEFSDYVRSLDAALIIYNLSDIRQRLGIDIPPTISISSYARLFLASLINREIDRIIYMDVDAINNRSFLDLFKIDLSGHSLAGVLDDVALRAKRLIGLLDESPYINAGFLYINLKYWRDYKLQDKFLAFLHSHDGNVFHHDQGIINAVCNDSMMILHPEYNMVSNFFSHKFESFTQKPFYSENEMEEGKENPVFIHFTPGVVNRPWLKNCRHPLLPIYLKYRNATPAGKKGIAPDNRPFRLKLLSWLFFNFHPAYTLVLTLRNHISHKI